MGKRIRYSDRDSIRQGAVSGPYRVKVLHTVASVAAGAGIGFGKVVLDDFPVGRMLVTGVEAQLQFAALDANLIATWSGNFALGSVADADGAFAGAELDLLANQAIGPAVAGVIASAKYVTATGGANLILNNDSGSLAIFLNMNVAAASQTDATTANIRVTGFVNIILTQLG